MSWRRARRGIRADGALRCTARAMARRDTPRRSTCTACTGDCLRRLRRSGCSCSDCSLRPTQTGGLRSAEVGGGGRTRWGDWCARRWRALGELSRKTNRRRAARRGRHRAGPAHRSPTILPSFVRSTGAGVPAALGGTRGGATCGRPATPLAQMERHPVLRPRPSGLRPASPAPRPRRTAGRVSCCSIALPTRAPPTYAGVLNVRPTRARVGQRLRGSFRRG